MNKRFERYFAMFMVIVVCLVFLLSITCIPKKHYSDGIKSTDARETPYEQVIEEATQIKIVDCEE